VEIEASLGDGELDLWSLNLRHLRAFAEVVRLGSVSDAASAVALTQPAITQAVAKLERQLGLPLFDRRSDGMAANEAAIALAARIEAALRHVGSHKVSMSQVKALIAVAAEGSYAGGALRIGAAKPTLHRAIKDLSFALRKALVVRRGKGVALTESGVRTVRGFRLACAELGSALDEVEQRKGFDVGRIAIGALPVSRARLLPAAVTRYRQRHPQVALAIVEGAYHELLEPLRNGELDMLVGSLRPIAPGGDLMQIPLFEDRPVILARAGHPAARPGVTLAELGRHEWVMPPADTPLRQQWEAMFRGQALDVPRVPIESGSVLFVRQILRETDCLTMLSLDQQAVELEAGILVRIALPIEGAKRTIGLTLRADWRPTARQSEFIETLTAVA
jgi:LysR family transcriptional regulator of gallate degradation